MTHQNLDPNEEIFRDYLHQLADEIADSTAPKAREYGTTELAQLGATLSHVAGVQVTNYAHATQNAVWFYASGKLARWTAAVARRQQPSRDTVYDLLIYCLMWLKIHETGEWWPDTPGAREQSPDQRQADEFISAIQRHPAGKGLMREDQVLRQDPDQGEPLPGDED